MDSRVDDSFASRKPALDHALRAAWGAQFAATACTIVSGAIAERAKFEAYMCYSFFMAAWVYPV